MELRLDGDEASDYLNFVVKDEDSAAWYDFGGTNFQVGAGRALGGGGWWVLGSGGLWGGCWAAAGRSTRAALAGQRGRAAALPRTLAAGRPCCCAENSSCATGSGSVWPRRWRCGRSLKTRWRCR